MRSPLIRNQSLFSKPAYPKRPKHKWRVMGFLGRAFKRMLMVIGFFVLMGAVIGTFSSSLLFRDAKVPSLPEKTILFMPLKETFVEHKNALGYALGDKVPAIRDVITTIEQAAQDNRVKGLVVGDQGGKLSLVHLEELRSAVMRFRETGKKTYFYSPSFESLGAYYLASAFEEIWMQPIGILNIPGINAEMPYAREALDNLGIKPQVFARKDYKNLFENVTSSEMSDASREALESVILTLADTIKMDIADSREISAQEFQKAIDKGLLLDSEALDAGLIDVLGYGDSLNRKLIESITGDPESDEKVFTTLAGYGRATAHEKSVMPPVGKRKEKVALIYIVGQIVQFNIDGTNTLSSAESLVGLIRAAADQDDIKSVVIRVDSPGGSPVASESIRRAIVRAQEKGKSVIISMGAAAASGGYWISAPADYIFASPLTFTGSIGVTGGKFSLQEMWDKLDINWDGVSWGENSTLWSYNHPYTASETERMNALMDEIYNSFVAHVAEGRNMTQEEVDKVAGGRVWLGAQAVELGLVDELGSLDDALDYAAQLLGHENRRDLNIIVMPKPKTTLEKIIEFLEMQAHMGYMYHMQVKFMNWLEPVIKSMGYQENHVSALAVFPKNKL